MSDRISRITTVRSSAHALSHLSLAGLAAAVALALQLPVSVLAAGLPAASLDMPPVAVTELTSFHYNGQGESTGEGARGWPSMADPSSPPLFVTHPLSQRPYLFGGSIGQALQAIGSVGLWWMPASPGHYERLAVDQNRVYGLIPGTPVKGSDGSIYGVVVSMFAESMAADAAETAQYAHAVRKGVVFRTEFDGTHLVPITSTRGKLNMPNGALIIDAQDNLYGVDKGEQGNGRIFRVGADGSFSTLHEFGPGPDGRKQVVNDIILGSDGWIYGVSGYDRGLPKAPGVSNDPELAVGALFRIHPVTPGNGPAILHTFRLKEGEISVQAHSANDELRYYPSGATYVRGTPGDVTIATNGVASMTGLSSLVEGPDGYLYGTTSINRCQVYARWQAVLTVYNSVSAHTPLCGYRYYGANVLPQNEFPHYDGSVAHGALYRIPKDAADQGELQLLHVFSGTDGSTPRGPLAVGKDGNIYGTTLSGGSNHHWLYGTRLLDHPPTCEDLGSNADRQRCAVIGAENYASSTGYRPIAYADRALPNGTLYRVVTSALAPDETGRATQSGFQSLHSFKYDVDGFRPMGVKPGADGRLYGVTSRGGKGFVNQRGETQPYDDHGAVFVVDLDGNTPSAAITMTVTPNEIGEGQNATLTWTSYQTRDCQATSSKGDWQGAVEANGSVTLTPPSGTLYYTMQCIDSVKGTTVSDVVVLYVNAPVTGRDGNVNNYGNGGGGSLPYGLLGLLGLVAAWYRRGQSRQASV